MGKFRNSGKEPAHRRSKYVDHSLRFVDWVDNLGFEKTFFGRLVQELDRRFQVRRLGVLFLFSLGLSLLLFADFDFSDNVTAGDVATRDIKSPISIELVDEIATEEKRLAAERAVPLTFDQDLVVYEEFYNRVYQSFRHMREEIRQTKWASDELRREEQVKDFLRHKAEFEKLLGRSIADRHFEWLASKRFGARIENMIIETLENWAQHLILNGLEKSIQSGQTEITVREISRSGRGRETTVDVRRVRDLAMIDDFQLDNVLGFKSLTLKDQRILTAFARSLVVPNLTLNKQETESRRQRAREAVLPVVISIKKNQVIVPEGSVVLPIHETLLKEIRNQKSHRNRDFVALVSALLFVVMILVSFSYLRRFTFNRVRIATKDLVVMGVVTVVVVSLTKLFLFLTHTAIVAHFGSVVPQDVFLFAAPAAAGTMLVGLLISSGEVVWIFSLFLSVVLAVMVDMDFSFLLVTVTGSLAAARGVFSCKTRNDIYKAGVRTGLVNSLTILLVVTLASFGTEEFTLQVLWTVPAGMFSGLLSALVAMMLIPLLETMFNYTTDVKLLELSNLNHPLLKEMIVKAPGTYHHSLIVGSMVESAAEEIGANPLLAKVMSYYHDIGKTGHAAYFIENQKPGQNPHDHLSPFMSKTILIAHVKDGVELGMEYKLGKPIIDGIVQHHGTTLIAFFYNRALEMQDEEIDSVLEGEFRYPGPKPQFREAALIMLADSIEAASRSLDEPTPVRLQNIVKNIIQRKFMDGQLDECNLTLKELSIIEQSFIRVLLGIYHQRIDYPKAAGGGTHEAPEVPPKVSKLNGKKGSATA